jgi:formiminotetrahydrofolate cyclodeaminase
MSFQPVVSAMIKDESVAVFLDQLASKASTPGGGSAAAIMGAMGAALVSMVCNLTIGKEKYAAVEGEMKALVAESEKLRAELTAHVNADVQAFDQVMAAYGLPKGDDAEKAARTAAIQTALRTATEVPLACARTCAAAIALSRRAAELGNLNVISDAGVAVMAAYAGLKSAALNVYINVGSLKDEAFATAARNEIEALVTAGEGATPEIYAIVRAKL